MKLKTSLSENKQIIIEELLNTDELVVKDFFIAKKSACIFYIKGITDVKSLSEYVLLPCTQVSALPKGSLLQYLKENVLLLTEVEEESSVVKIGQMVAKGKAVLLVEGQDKALMLAVEKINERPMQEPPTSAVLRGPREGFTENIKTNLAALRKIVATPKLKTEKMEIGKLTKTKIVVMYLNNVADKKVVKKITDKIKLINIDGVIDSYYVLQYLEERPKSIFKQAGLSEKPDIVAGKLLEGRVAILVDGSPIVITLPFILIEDLHSADDYYQQQYRVIVIRLIRLISIALTVLLPGLYIGMQMFHYRAIPLRFLVTILNSTQGLPFTPFAEIIVVIVLFEILYEASLRMPKYLGLALSIVGALILGDTAVKAGLISPPSVMIVAVSGITIYTIPDEAAQLSLLRLFFTIAGGLLGFYGLIWLAILLVVYLSDFDNYGAPYLAPYAPKIKLDRGDAIFRSDWVNNKRRPISIPNQNSTRTR